MISYVIVRNKPTFVTLPTNILRRESCCVRTVNALLYLHRYTFPSGREHLHRWTAEGCVCFDVECCQTIDRNFLEALGDEYLRSVTHLVVPIVKLIIFIRPKILPRLFSILFSCNFVDELTTDQPPRGFTLGLAFRWEEVIKI